MVILHEQTDGNGPGRGAVRFRDSVASWFCASARLEGRKGCMRSVERTSECVLHESMWLL